MISAAFLAVGDLFSPALRSVLVKAIGWTLVLFAAAFVAVQFAVSLLARLPWPWADTVLEIGAGLLLMVAFFFLMAPVAALFAGLYLDEVAARVETSHYPKDPPGQPLSAGRTIATAVKFALVVLLVNLAVLPLVFTGIGAVALVGANAYLISREYFEMAAMRHMPEEEARQLRRENTPHVFVAGLLPALASLVPLLNLFVPLFATSYFVHLFKQVEASSGRSGRDR